MVLLIAVLIVAVFAPRYWMVPPGAAFAGGLELFLAFGSGMPMSGVRSEWAPQALLPALYAGLLYLALGTAIYWAKRGMLWTMGRRRPPKALSNID